VCSSDLTYVIAGYVVDGRGPFRACARLTIMTDIVPTAPLVSTGIGKGSDERR